MTDSLAAPTPRPRRRRRASLDESEQPMATSVNDTLPVVAEHVTTFQNEKGKTIISDGVVAKIAGLAVKEVEGVHALVSRDLGQMVVGLARAVARQQNRDTGILVEVGEKEAAVDVKISAEYGVNLTAVAAAVRNNVIGRVESMTGLIVKEVNVAIVDLYFPEDEVEAPVRRVE
jgi:uncharacterized alkaline shock family protein YloU